MRTALKTLQSVWTAAVNPAGALSRRNPQIAKPYEFRIPTSVFTCKAAPERDFGRIMNPRHINMQQYREFQQDILREQVRLAMEQLPTMQGASFVVALILGYVVCDTVPHTSILEWFTLILLIVLSRIILHHRFAKVRDGSFDGHLWQIVYLVSALISGIIWGLSAFIIFPAGDLLYISLFVLVIASLASATTVSHSSIRFAPTAWSAPAMIFYAIRCTLYGEKYGYTVGLLSIIFLVTILRYSFKHNDSITSGILMKFENLKLLEEVRSANNSLSREIAERKTIQDNLSALIISMPDEVWFVDTHLRITLANPAAIRSCGLGSASEMSLENMSAYLEVCRPDGTPQPLEEAPPFRALKGETVRNHEEMARIPSTGELRHRQVTSSPVMDANGSIFGAVSVVRDITERKHGDAKLKQAYAAAEAANKAKSEFLANMSHEIRTPMNAVLGLAQMLEREPLSRDQRDMVRGLRTAGQSLLDLLNDILDFSKIEAGQLRIERRPFALTPLLTHLESLLGNVARAKGILLTIEASTGLEGGLMGDPLRLTQILTNLIGNSIKFTEQGEIRVRVKPLDLGGATARLRFEVQDTGVGIAPDVVSSLFTPFTQADTSITRRYGGTGLGLSICRRLVDLMGGLLGAESTVGEGSTFWFELSFDRTASSQAFAFSPPRDAAFAGPRLGGRSFLVVDDSVINQSVVARALKLEGAEVTLAEDGAKALDQLRLNPEGFDAVLMDVQMPVMDGLTATRSIRGELRLNELPVIAFTAGVLRKQEEEAFAAGVNDFLAKPVDLEQMVGVLLRWMRPGISREDTRPLPGPAESVPLHDINPGFPEIAGIDTRKAVATLDGDAAFFLEMLREFAAKHGDTAQLIHADLAGGDRKTAARRAHSLRGVVGNLGAMDLMQAARTLEDAILEDRTDLDALLGQFSDKLTSLIEACTPWIR